MENETEPRIELDASADYELYEDLLQVIQHLRNEFNEDFAENCKTQKLTEQQKTLVPLMAQALSARVLYNHLEDIKTVMAGIAKALKADKGYWEGV